MPSTFDFSPGEYRLKPADAHWERAACAALRRAVFCTEQRLFESDDSDAIDATALHLAALTCVIAQPEQVVGTVRLHEQMPGIWFGSRLAVRREYRCHSALGHRLIRHAVCTARAHGCEQFFAHVQLRNAPLFRRLHWQALETVELYGHTHVLMRAELAHFPPAMQPEVAIYTTSATAQAAASRSIPCLEAA